MAEEEKDELEGLHPVQLWLAGGSQLYGYVNHDFLKEGFPNPETIAQIYMVRPFRCWEMNRGGQCGVMYGLSAHFLPDAEMLRGAMFIKTSAILSYALPCSKMIENRAKQYEDEAGQLSRAKSPITIAHQPPPPQKGGLHL